MSVLDITKKKASVFAVALLTLIFLWPVGSLFPDDYSRIVIDRNGNILRATCATDGQIRFRPDGKKLPSKYITAVTTIEDRRFFYHPGVDPFSIINACVSNIRAGKKLRGGSTITMQVVRLSDSRPRTYISKVVECICAIRLSLQKSKMDILRLYAAHVPMGGNVVGIWSASRYYFGKPLEEITWAEAALFTVLPNNPSMINIKKQRSKLKLKRDRALRILFERGHIDSITCVLSMGEPLPQPQNRIPFEACHFAQKILNSFDGDFFSTTLDKKIQCDVESIIGRYSREYREYGVVNISALIINTQTNEVLAYAGSQGYNDTVNSGRVDGVMALRSSGSLLKPLLVAKALDRGPWLLQSRIQDVPTFYGTFAPSNASKDFQGIVTVEQMLIQSLNVPAVRLLYDYGQADFYRDLKEMGVNSLFRSADGYGLSLILGGAEVSLWDMCKIYCGLGNGGVIRPTRILTMDKEKKDSLRLCSPGASWLVLSTISKLNRPDNESYWQLFSDKVPVAWKTGTSYGQKDAWAVGVNKQWTIGVWVGNFTGEGNNFLGGAVSAGPVLLSLFRQLTDLTKPVWFQCPEYDLKRVNVCAATGYLPGPSCPQSITVLQPSGAWKTEQCSWHRKIVIDRVSGYEVCSRCWQGIERKDTALLIYPAAAAEIMRSKGMKSDVMPSHLSFCTAVQNRKNAVNIEYPIEGITLFIPRGLNGDHQKIVCKASSQTDSPLFWYLDGKYVGKTNDVHTLAIGCETGNHILSVFDKEGGEEKVGFGVVTSVGK